MPSAAKLTTLSAESLDALNRFLPAHWSHGNPIDILGDADPERYQRAAEIALADPNSDGLLVILAPQGMTNPAEVAERLKPHAHAHGKPLLASWMGGASVAGGEVILNTAGIPTFAYPDTATRIFTLMWRYAYNLRGIYETPVLADGPQEESEARGKIRTIIEEARSHGRTLLTEYESKQIAHAVRNSGSGDPDRAQRGRSCGGGGGDRVSGRREIAFGDHHAQEPTLAA